MGETMEMNQEKISFSLKKREQSLAFSKETFGYLSFLFLKQEEARDGFAFGNAQVNCR
jgi:hypothetical protein